MTYTKSEHTNESVPADNSPISTSTPCPPSLIRPISPPPSTKRRPHQGQQFELASSTAAVEAGETEISDHLTFFSEKLWSARRPQPPHQPRLNHQDWINLYTRNLNERGHHFVIHQHDHPVAGTHYDLRLQCNATSSISFAIMYGLPGDPNSRRLNRNATETRVHNLWNHLIETASHQTGTMLLWDTGEYEVLPYLKHSSSTLVTTDDEDNGDDAHTPALSDDNVWRLLSEPQKLHRAFQQRKLRLRLNGTRLPTGYTVSLRLTTDNFRGQQPGPPKRRRKRLSPSSSNLESQKYQRRKKQKDYETTDSEADLVSAPRGKPVIPALKRNLSSLKRTESPPPSIVQSPSLSPFRTSSSQSETSGLHQKQSDFIALASDDDNQQECTQNSTTTNNNDKNLKEELETIRLTNAYPGATNDINSIHQRRWYLSLDRSGSGFIKSKQHHHSSSQWIPKSSLSSPSLSDNSANKENQNENENKTSIPPEGFTPFHVRGRDHETSIVTGRLASDILADEGVVGYVPRGLWRGITN